MSNPNPFPAHSSKTQSSFHKAGNKGTLCVLVVDESGSMSSFQDDTIGGMNSFIKSQKEDNDGTKISIVKFEGGNVREPFSFVPAEDMPILSRKDYQPLGSTNLNDAIGYTINKVNAHLGSLPESDRPSVIIQIMTDGHENSSREYTAEQIKSMVKSTQNDNDWIFTFVGANIDAFSTSSSYGFSAAATSSFNTKNMGSTLETYGSSVTRMKSMRSMGLSANAIYESGQVWTDEERTKMGK